MLTLCSAFEVMALNDGAGNEFFNSKVGIKDSSPSATLEVNGEVLFGNTSIACTSSSMEGSQRYNLSSHRMEFCNNTNTWVSMASNSGPSSFFYVHRNLGDPLMSIPNGQETVIQWTAEVDYNNEFDNNKFTAAKAGVYLIIVKAGLSNSPAVRFIDTRIRKNNFDIAYNNSGIPTATTLNTIVTALVELNAGDYIEGVVTHSNTASLNLDNNPAITYMMGVKVSD